MSQPFRGRTYGPVPSRRFGLSLGIDLVPRKACCFDCIYCQVGPTTLHTASRQAFVDVAATLREVEQALSRGPAPQIITVAGSGEPTLAAELPQVVDGLRALTSIPLGLITNGATLWESDVCEVALRFDVVSPSLDAGDAATFARINRPCNGVTFDRVVAGLEAFTARFQGLCRLEVMLVSGVNDSPASLAAIGALVRRLPVQTVDLNTVVRPPAHGAQALSLAALEQARTLLGDGRVCIIATPPDSAAHRTAAAPPRRERIIATVARRPCTATDLTLALGASESEVAAIAEQLVAEDLLCKRVQSGRVYYAVVDRDSE